MIDYAFQRLGLRKITSGDVIGNVARIKGNPGLGFQEEGVFKKQFFIDGRYSDIVWLGLFSQGFQKLSFRKKRTMGST